MNNESTFEGELVNTAVTLGEWCAWRNAADVELIRAMRTALADFAAGNLEVLIRETRAVTTH